MAGLNIPNVNNTFGNYRNDLYLQNNRNVSKENTNIKDINKDTFDYSKDDGVISTKDKIKNFGKGLISPVTEMFSSPKNFIVGVGMIALGVGLTVATGGAALPFLVAAGVTMGGIQFGKSAYAAANAKTDKEAEEAWQGMGTGTSITGLSVLGAKSSLKGAGVDTEGLNALTATTKCFKETPSSVSKSIQSFKSGEYKNNLGFNSSKTNAELTTKEQSNAGNIKTQDVAKPTENIQEQKVNVEQTQEKISPAKTEPQNQAKSVQEIKEQNKDKMYIKNEELGKTQEAKNIKNEIKVAPKEPQKILTKEEILAQKIEENFKKEQILAEKFVNKHYDELKSMFIDENGNIVNPYEFAKKTPLSIEDYLGEKKFYHQTAQDSKDIILNEGFRQDIAPKHGYRDGIGGVYFSTTEPKAGSYGSSVIETEFQGRIASLDTDLLNDIKVGGGATIENKYGCNIGETIAEKFLQKLFKENGYQGIIGTNISDRAGCRYFAALDTSLIKIIN